MPLIVRSGQIRKSAGIWAISRCKCGKNPSINGFTIRGILIIMPSNKPPTDDPIPNLLYTSLSGSAITGKEREDLAIYLIIRSCDELKNVSIFNPLGAALLFKTKDRDQLVIEFSAVVLFSVHAGFSLILSIGKYSPISSPSTPSMP